MSFFLVLFSVSTFSHRFFVLFFELIARNKNSLTGTLSGLASDMSLVLLVFFLCSFLLFLSKNSPKIRRFLDTLFVFLGLVSFAFYVIHLRYVDFFGMQLKTFHIFSLKSMPLSSSGFSLLFESTITLYFFFLVLSLSLFLWFYLAKKTTFFSRLENLFSVCSFVLVFSLINSLWIHLRKEIYLNHELKSTPFSALYYEFRNEGENFKGSVSTVKEAKRLRQLLEGNRSYVSEDYPLWQKTLPSAPLIHGEEKLFKEFQSFLRLEEEEHGPWNIVLILSESLRAYELEAFGLNEPSHKGLTPNISKLSEEYGVRFTNFYSPSFGTRKGQPALLCSLYTFHDRSVMNLNPTSNLRCLNSIFKKEGYSTGFFSSSGNGFDNAATFYQSNNMDLVHGEEMIPKQKAKSGWGFSDHALFNHFYETLPQLKEPFFAVNLTSTNHGPFMIPEDVPKGLIKEDLPLRTHQVVQYVDWAFGELFNKIKKKYPHTLFILAADEGKPGKRFTKPPTFEQIYMNMRTPLLILSPKMPSHLKGAVSKAFGSSVDFAPTLLHLLSREDKQQQFMGQSLFQKKRGFYMNLSQEEYFLKQEGEKFKIYPLEKFYAKDLTSLVYFNRIFPPNSHME